MAQMKSLACIGFLFFISRSVAQVLPDVKTDDIYSQQLQISNNIPSGSLSSSAYLADARSLVSIDQSGDGNISLPIVNVKGRKLSLPLSIQYNTNGIKVDQRSSDVGLGWNISFGSIVREYGAYEPDYTYNGSEFKMLRDNGTSLSSGELLDGKLKSYMWTWSSTSGWTSPTFKLFDPINQNKILKYNNMAHDYCKAPDNYIINVPGLGNNDFWNGNSVVPEYGTPPPPAQFVFSENVPWKVETNESVFEFSQEISRINEFTYHSTSSTTLQPGLRNFASAIAFLPYVVDQQFSHLVTNPPNESYVSQDQLISTTTGSPVHEVRSPYTVIKYRDYSCFTIITSDGTKYIFGRPLRGQKYLFSDEPFWSAMNTTAWTGGTSPVAGVTFNEFWKTDYIAEWLLTEILSADYVDVNSNGPDNADRGDWIKIEYTDPIRYENIQGVPAAIPIPKHQEYLNFTQTDRQSSLWRERAYVKKILTPVQQIDFETSERFEVDHDYFNKPFNRIAGDYKYIGKSMFTPGWPISHIDYTTSTAISPEVVDNSIEIKYPIDLRKYDRILVKNMQNNLVQNVTLNYAAIGSSQQLAVSRRLILKNDKITFNAYNPSDLGYGLDPSFFSVSDGPEGRGKTTLLGVDYRGSSTTSTNKISYSFEYGYNPSLSDIHMHQIWQMAANSSIREALQNDGSGLSYTRWRGIRGFTVPSTTPPIIYNIPNSILPWKTVEIVGPSTFSVPFSPISSEELNLTFSENLGNPVYKDELGYFFKNSMTNNGRHAWSLSRVNLPYGGHVQLSYELDQSDVVQDRIKWGITDYALPEVGHYNNLAHYRSILQYINNTALLYSTISPPNNLVRPYKEFYFMMNSTTGGLRVKQIDIVDNYTSTPVSRSFEYGPGHYTAPPPSYWENYMKGFGEFLQTEHKRHGNMDAEGRYESYGVIGTFGSEYSEFILSMMRLNFQLKVDYSYQKFATHYYEYVDEIGFDHSKTRRLYGAPIPTSSDGRISYLPISYGSAKNGVDMHNVVNVMGGNLLSHVRSIVNYSNEYYNAAGDIQKKTETEYVANDYDANSISSNTVIFAEREYRAYLPYFMYGMGLHPIPTYGTSSPLGSTYELFPTAIQHTLFSDFPIGFLNLMNYTSGDPTTLNSIGLGRNPLLKMGIQSGKYSGTMPAWVSELTSQPTGWTGSYTDSWVKDQINNSFNSILTENDQIGGSDLHTYFKDKKIKISGLSYFNQRSSNLFPNHTRTINFFY